MEHILHEKEEEGVFYGSLSYLSEGSFAGSFEAKCSQACVNMILQKSKFLEGISVIMDDIALTQAVDALHIRSYFGLSQLSQMENLFLQNWAVGQLEVLGSLLAMYEALKAEGLSLLPLTASLHPSVASANTSPESVKGYLFMLEDHWLVMRQMKRQWYKFDPWLTGAQLLNDFYLSLYIKQLLADGKLVFVIDGEFPICPADEQEAEIVEDETPLIESQDCEGKCSLDLSEQELQENLRFLSLVFEGEDNELALALLLSLEDDIRRQRENQSTSSEGPSTSQVEGTGMQCSSSTADKVVDRIIDSVENGIEDTGNVSCSSVEDLSSTFCVMFDEPGDGSYCLTLPPVSDGNTGTSGDVPSGSDISNPPRAHPTPKVFITTSSRSEFKNVLSERCTVQEEDPEEDMCCVCMSNPPSHVVVPCGHYCLCMECSVSIQEADKDCTYCPLCKQSSSSIIKLYK